jgi:hypothetical protein
MQLVCNRLDEQMNALRDRFLAQRASVDGLRAGGAEDVAAVEGGVLLCVHAHRAHEGVQLVLPLLPACFRLGTRSGGSQHMLRGQSTCIAILITLVIHLHILRIVWQHFHPPSRGCWLAVNG